MCYYVILPVGEIEYSCIGNSPCPPQAKAPPKRDVHFCKSVHARPVAVLVGSPSLVHTVNGDYDVSPWVFPSCRYGKGILWSIDNLVAIVGRRRIAAVLCPLEAVVCRQGEPVPPCGLPCHVGCDVNTRRSYLCEVHHPPYEHIERNGNYLVLHFGNIGICRCHKCKAPHSCTKAVFCHSTDIPLRGCLGQQVVSAYMIIVQFVEGGHSERTLPESPEHEAVVVQHPYRHAHRRRQSLLMPAAAFSAILPVPAVCP